MTRITPFFWFGGNAEQAVKHYTAIFPRSKIGRILRYDEISARAAGRPVGSVLTVAFELDGQPFTALNGNPVFKFTEAISFVVHCQTQREVDYFWRRLSAGGRPGQCGWLKDKFGVSWQIVPSGLEELLNSRHPGKSERVMKALMSMTKLDARALRRAYEGRRARRQIRIPAGTHGSSRRKAGGAAARS
jgi:predicted 3-demethylubiquinone-9 3-methyltransferase (glyoxalase superfamily)